VKRSDFNISKKLCLLNTSLEFNEGDKVKVKALSMEFKGEIAFIGDNLIEFSIEDQDIEVLSYDDIYKIELDLVD